MKAVRRRLADEAGVAGLLIAGLVAIIAFTSLTVYLRGYFADREFARVVGKGSRSNSLVPATMTYLLSQSTHRLPCPDVTATPDGTADETSNVCDGTTGVIPWVTLGISREDVIDPYGNYYRYSISTVARSVCSTVTSDIPGATATTTFTGGLVDPTDLTFIQANGESRNVPFVIISHGENGLGAKSGATGASRPNPTSANEVANTDATLPATIHGGPYTVDTDTTDGTDTTFDDQVMAPTTSQLRQSCEELTPAGKLNAEVAENFSDPTISTTKFATPNNVTSIVQPGAPGNRVGEFDGAVAYLATNASYSFLPTVRPVYVSALWIPNADASGGTPDHGGISIATRVTLADLDDNDSGVSNDIFDENTALGLTFRFYETGISGGNSSDAGVTNTISIQNSDGTVTTTGDNSYTLINGETYRLEVYDNGSDAWMRITQVDNTSNTAMIRGTDGTDLSGEQRVMFINDFQTPNASVSYLDDLVIGVPMLALETGLSATDIVTSGGNNNGSTTRNLTVEAWVKVKAFPTGSNRAALISQWNLTASASSQSYRLYFDGANNDQLAFDIGTTLPDIDSDPDTVTPGFGTEHFDLQFKPDLDKWNHIAVSFDYSSKVVRLYVNGDLAAVGHSSSSSGAGINTSISQPLTVGALYSGSTVSDVFTGNISDVRIWNVVRDSASIRSGFKNRLSLALTQASDGLVANWVFDNESGTVSNAENVQADPSTATDGDLQGSAVYVASLATYTRPLSTDTGFCPVGTRAGPYQCDFRTSSASGSTSSSVRIPANLRSFYAKVWGAGGGGYDPSGTTMDTPGGPGGFTGGLVRQVGPSGSLEDVYDKTLAFYTGGYGTGSLASREGGGGGAGSGIYYTNSTPVTSAVVVAGGGGGAAYSANGGTCSSTGVLDSNARCGIGDVGGGYNTSITNARAPSSTTLCGGRRGDNSPGSSNPPNATCPNPTGTTGDPSGQIGGGDSAGTGPAGGAPAFIAGGRGFTATSSGSRIGGAGGGGGFLGGEAGGYDDGANTTGFGGGGGSGTIGAGVVNGVGALGSVTYNAAGSYVTSATGSWTTGNYPVTVTMSTVTIGSGGWIAGCTLTAAGGARIGSGGNTIESVGSSSSYTFVLQNATNGANGTVYTNVTLTFDCSSVIIPGFSTTAGNASDAYYSPSYLNTTANEDALEHPGRGGTTEVTNSTSRNGKGGAIVILW